jgi:hypothetical protein
MNASRHRLFFFEFERASSIAQNVTPKRDCAGRNDYHLFSLTAQSGSVFCQSFEPIFAHPEIRPDYQRRADFYHDAL